MTPSQPRPSSPSEADRKTIFAALVAALAGGPAAPAARVQVAHRFGVSEYTLLAIEREGVAKVWGPLRD